MSAKNKSKNLLDKHDRIFKSNDFIRVEAFNTLRSNIRLCLRKDTTKKILVTSAISGEGKSSCSSNLAVSIANSGKKVILVDCDLRKPVVHKTFKIPNKVGLSNVLAGITELPDAIFKSDYDNLYLLPSGERAPNPSEMLASQEMKDLVKLLEKDFEYIILDCPPINVVSDAIPLFEAVDGIVISGMYGRTTHPELSKALSAIQFAKANLLGIFWFGQPENSSVYGKYIYKVTGYGYGYGNRDYKEKYSYHQ